MLHTALIKFNPEAFKLYDPEVDTHIDKDLWLDDGLDAQLMDNTLLPTEPVRVVLCGRVGGVHFLRFCDNPHIKVRWLVGFDEDGNYDSGHSLIRGSFGGVTFFDIIMSKPLEEKEE